MKAQPNRSVEPWRFALEAIETGEPATLVTVVEHSGSVPGVAGTFVVVTADGQAGTVGGGEAEHEVVERARGCRAAELVEFVHTEAEGGTLCSGVQLFSLLPLARSQRKEIEEVVTTLENHRTGSLSITPQGLAFVDGSPQPMRFERQGDDWLFTQPIGLVDTLTIIGGGHVALALSRVMATLPFRIVVLDNRTDLPTMAANRHAHELRVVDFGRIADEVPEGERSWVVVMTFGHHHDREVVERLLGRRFRYLGLMGSLAKVRKMFADMVRDGADPDHLARVRAPVGVPIGSHTPEEIAISVAAELVALRNGVEV